jgi:hypothetical protein
MNSLTFTEKQQEVVWMRFGRRASIRQIAIWLNISRRAVLSRLANARRRSERAGVDFPRLQANPDVREYAASELPGGGFRPRQIDEL